MRPFPAVFGGRRPISTPESLWFTEVLRRVESLDVIAGTPLGYGSALAARSLLVQAARGANALRSLP
jgi:hypothetical protein